MTHVTHEIRINGTADIHINENPLEQDMPGTENTSEYRVVHANELGRVGVRTLESDRYRIRVEPADDRARQRINAAGQLERPWKQPGDNEQDRWSLVARGKQERDRAVGTALQALGFYN